MNNIPQQKLKQFGEIYVDPALFGQFGQPVKILNQLITKGGTVHIAYEIERMLTMLEFALIKRRNSIFNPIKLNLPESEGEIPMFIDKLKRDNKPEFVDNLISQCYPSYYSKKSS